MSSKYELIPQPHDRVLIFRIDSIQICRHSHLRYRLFDVSCVVFDDFNRNIVTLNPVVCSDYLSKRSSPNYLFKQIPIVKQISCFHFVIEVFITIHIRRRRCRCCCCSRRSTSVTSIFLFIPRCRLFVRNTSLCQLLRNFLLRHNLLRCCNSCSTLFLLVIRHIDRFICVYQSNG